MGKKMICILYDMGMETGRVGIRSTGRSFPFRTRFLFSFSVLVRPKEEAGGMACTPGSVGMAFRPPPGPP